MKVIGEILLPSPSTNLVFGDNGSFMSVVLPLDSYFIDVTTLTDDGDILGAQWEPFYTHNLEPNRLYTDGDAIKAIYCTTTAENDNRKELRITIDGEILGEIEINQNGGLVEITFLAIRAGDTLRCYVSYECTAEHFRFYEAKTSMDFTSVIPIILEARTTDQDGDITGVMGNMIYIPFPVDTTPPEAPEIVSFED